MTNSVSILFEKSDHYLVARVSRNQQDDIKNKKEDMDEEMAEDREERTQAVFAEAQPVFSIPASSQPDLQGDAQKMDVAASDISHTERGEMNRVEPPPPPPPPPPVSQTEIPV